MVEQKAEIEGRVDLRALDLERALEAQTTLLHEVDDRVKNNLTMIGALLRLQSRSLPDARLRATLETMLERVDALASAHRRLYQSDDITLFEEGGCDPPPVSPCPGSLVALPTLAASWSG